jgi:hypothetical protein
LAHARLRFSYQGLQIASRHRSRDGVLARSAFCRLCRLLSRKMLLGRYKKVSKVSSLDCLSQVQHPLRPSDPGAQSSDAVPTQPHQDCDSITSCRALGRAEQVRPLPVDALCSSPVQSQPPHVPRAQRLRVCHGHHCCAS